MARAFDYEAEKEALRERQRQHLATIREAEEAEHDRTVAAYWAERTAEDPDDPEVLRARASLIDRDRAVGTTVAAASAKVTGKAR